MGNMLYNGVELPDINEVWTEDVKAEYPYALLFFNTTNATLGFSLLSQVPSFRDGGLYIQSGAWKKSCSLNGWEWEIGTGYVQPSAGVYLNPDINIPIWSSHKVVNSDDGSTYLNTSDPIDTGRTVVPKVLYNGVELSTIATITKYMSVSGYPNAMIRESSSGEIHLFVLGDVTKPYMHSNYILASGAWMKLVLVDEIWEYYDSGDSTTFSVSANKQIIWTNFDIYTDETQTEIYFAATDPVDPNAPTTPTITDPLSFAMGWQLGCRLRAQRAVKPDVFTIEWDGEVTEPNYNEYYCRVTERIFTEQELTGAIAVFGGTEYTNLYLMANDPQTTTNAGKGFWMTIDSVGNTPILISGKAGLYQPPLALGTIGEFNIPADGTYFVRQWDSDGKYTERVTFPNVK